jgi:Arc-like DNA binding domain
MANVTLKGIPEYLHQQLKREAEANFRSLNQEVLARIERTFELDAALHTKRDQKWIDEALASGPATELTANEMNAIFKRVRKKSAA